MPNPRHGSSQRVGMTKKEKGKTFTKGELTLTQEDFQGMRDQKRCKGKAKKKGKKPAGP